MKKKLIVMVTAVMLASMLAACGDSAGQDGDKKGLFAGLKKEEDHVMYVDGDDRTIDGYISLENIGEEETYYDLDEDIFLQVNVGFRGYGHDQLYLHVEYDDQVDGIIDPDQVNLMEIIPIDITDGKHLIREADYNDYTEGLTESMFPEDGSYIIEVTLDKSVLFSDSNINRVDFCLCLGKKDETSYKGGYGDISVVDSSIILEKTDSQIIVKELKRNYE